MFSSLGKSSSVEDIREVVLGEELDILLTSGTEAVEKIVDVGVGELSGVIERGHVRLDIVVLLDGLNNVTLTVHLEELLGEHHVGVMDGHVVVTEITLESVDVLGVTVRALVVRNGPGGGSHNAKVLVSIRVH